MLEGVLKIFFWMLPDSPEGVAGQCFNKTTSSRELLVQILQYMKALVKLFALEKYILTSTGGRKSDDIY